MNHYSVRRLVAVMALGVLLQSCSLFGPSDDDSILTGMDFVGRGYDVFNRYANPSDVLAEVLDFQAMFDDGLVERIQLEQSEFNTVEGTTIDEYMTSLSRRASVSGSYAGFSGSVVVNFDASHYNYTEYSFATVETFIEKYSARIKLGTPLSSLKDYLTETAAAKINDPAVDPESVFVSCGTHVLRGIVIGGRLDYNVSADMSLVEGSKSIGVFAEASYDGIFSVDVSGDIVTASEMSSFNSARKQSLKVFGGSSEYGQYIIAGDEQGYGPWIQSVADSPVFCDFDRTTPIIPIWDLCDNPDRAAALESGYAAYAAKRAIEPTGTPLVANPCVVDIKLYDLGVVYTGPNPTADGYILLPQDLNEGAGGDYIYILVKYGLDTDPTAITGLYVRNTSLSDPEMDGMIEPDGFCDLNDDAGGDYIYLYFFRGGTQAIRSVALKNTTDSQFYYSVSNDTFSYNDDGGRIYGWYDSRDLNRNAGGDGIILGWSFDVVN